MQRRTNRLQVHREVLQDPHAAIFDDENIVKTNEMELAFFKQQQQQQQKMNKSRSLFNIAKRYATDTVRETTTVQQQPNYMMWAAVAAALGGGYWYYSRNKHSIDRKARDVKYDLKEGAKDVRDVARDTSRDVSRDMKK